MGKDLNGKELGTGIRQRKDGRYEARAMISGVQISLYNVSLKQLKKEFEEKKAQAQSGIDLKRREITLDEWFEEWFSVYKVPAIKETSIYPMRSKYQSSFGKRIGWMRVADIRNIDIQNVINDMKEEGRAVSSMRDALGRVRECLESAVHNRIITHNPCFEIVVPWENTMVRRRFLSEEEQGIFLKAVENNWYKEMFYVMFLSGLRIGEVGGLMWKDVDFQNGCININRSLSCNYQKGVKKMILTTPKTHNSYRKIPFMGEAEEMLLSQKKKQDKLKRELGDRYRAKGELADLVFVTSMGSPVLRYHAEKECKKVVNDINSKEAYEAILEQREPHYFDEVYPHAIRHTFCSRCFERGLTPKVVQALMGHNHYSTTMDIYTHVTERNIELETEKFGRAMQQSDRTQDE